MNRLIKKISVFAMPFIIASIFLEVRLSQIPTYLSLKKYYLESQLDQIEVLSTGLSYGNSINPQFFDHKAFNLFNDAEDFYYDTKVIEKYVDQMKKLKLIILPISYYSLDLREEIGPWAERTRFYNLIFGIPPSLLLSRFDPSFYSYLFAYGWLDVRNFIFNNFTNQMKNVMYSNGWREVGLKGLLETNETERAGLQSVDFFDYNFTNKQNVSFNLNLLSVFIEKCQKRRIQIILFTPPTYHFFYDKIDPEKYQNMQDSIEQISNRFKLKYYNFFNDNRFGSEDFYTSDHVNNLGAEKLSRIMNDIVNETLAQQD